MGFIRQVLFKLLPNVHNLVITKVEQLREAHVDKAEEDSEVPHTAEETEIPRTAEETHSNVCEEMCFWGFFNGP